MVLIFELNNTVPVFVPVTLHGTSNFIPYWVWILFVVVTLHQWSANFFISTQITFSIPVEGPLHLKPLEQNVCMCSCSDTGNMQLPYNSPGGYLVHVLFSQIVFFQLTAQGGLPENHDTFNTVKNFRAHSVFQGKRKLVKNPERETYIQYSEKFQGTLFFRASASCSKILNVKNIFNTVKNFRAQSVFQGKRKLLKNPECKTYIQYSEKFQGTLFFRASTSCSKILNVKNIFNTVNSGQLCFSGRAQSCSKILNGKKYIQYSEHFQVSSVFRASASC